MGFFNAIGGMFDGQPGSEIEDWMRRHGYGSGANPGASQGVSPSAPTAPQGIFSKQGFFSSPMNGLLGADAVNAGGAGSPQPAAPAPQQFPPQGGPIDQLSGVSSALRENAMKPAPKPEHHGSPFLRFLADNAAPMLMGAAAGASGDPLAGMKVSMAWGEMRQKRDDHKRSLELQKNAYAAIDADPNMTPQEKALAKVNIEEYQKKWAEQFGTHNVQKGDTLERGLGGGRRDTFTAPQVHEVGPDLIMTDPQGVFANRSPTTQPGASPALTEALANSRDVPAHLSSGGMQGASPSNGMTTPIYTGRTELERYADNFGDRGTDAWKSAAQDWRLRGGGPTAYEFRDRLQDQRLNQSDTNNRRTTGTSAANNVRNNATSRANNTATNATSRANNSDTNAVRMKLRGKRIGGIPITNDEPIAKGADGRPLVVRNGRWVPAG